MDRLQTRLPPTSEDQPSSAPSPYWCDASHVSSSTNFYMNKCPSQSSKRHFFEAAGFDIFILNH
jgi:hypothetical protein